MAVADQNGRERPFSKRAELARRPDVLTAFDTWTATIPSFACGDLRLDRHSTRKPLPAHD
jgi:hypothetical protein